MSNFRRSLMGGGNNGPVFVDWIEVDAMSGQEIAISFPTAMHIHISIGLMSLDSVNDNNTFLRTNNLSAFMHAGMFQLWNQALRVAGQLQTSISTLKQYSVQEYYDPTYNNSYIIGFDDKRSSGCGDRTEKDFVKLGIERSDHSNADRFRYYSCDIADNEDRTIKYYSLRPCLYNGEYGLWDTISNTFYGNSGTGTITGGYD